VRHTQVRLQSVQRRPRRRLAPVSPSRNHVVQELPPLPIGVWEEARVVVTDIQRPRLRPVLTVRPDPGDYRIEVPDQVLAQRGAPRLRIGDTIEVLLTPDGYKIRRAMPRRHGGPPGP